MSELPIVLIHTKFVIDQWRTIAEYRFSTWRNTSEFLKRLDYHFDFITDEMISFTTDDDTQSKIYYLGPTPSLLKKDAK